MTLWFLSNMAWASAAMLLVLVLRDADDVDLLRLPLVQDGEGEVGRVEEVPAQEQAVAFAVDELTYLVEARARDHALWLVRG